jgi:hypothetical protein
MPGSVNSSSRIKQVAAGRGYVPTSALFLSAAMIVLARKPVAGAWRSLPDSP